MAKNGKTAPKLPVQQLTILAICRFAEPVAMTSVYPYLPDMIQTFNIPSESVAKWAGLTSAVFSLSQALTGIAWGRMSDKWGRKPIILLALTCTMISSVMFGFSTSLPMAFFARSLQGLSNGNVGIIRTAVAELVPYKELQPRAFSVMPLVWTIASIFGPAFGGALVYPVKNYPTLFGGSKLFTKFPFALPNLVAAVLFLIGITTGFLFLQESLEDKKDRKDYGRILGSALTRSCRRRKRRQPKWQRTDDEGDPFLSHNANEMSSPISPRPKFQALGWKDILTRQSLLNLAVYTLLATHSVAYDQLLPIFMHHPIYPPSAPSAELRPFTSGFSLAPSRIGNLFTLTALSGTLIQLLLFPPLTTRFGALLTLRASLLALPIFYALTPFASLIPPNHPTLRQAALLSLMLLKGSASIFSFPCSTILLTNSARSLKVLGTLNGVATSVSAVGRGVGPGGAGWVFSFGVKHGGNTGWAFWGLGVLAAVGAGVAFWLEEGEGIGKGDYSGGDGGGEVETDRADDGEDENSREGTTLISPLIRHLGAAADGPVYEPDSIPESTGFLTPIPSREQRSGNENGGLRRITSPIGLRSRSRGGTPVGERNR